LGRHDDDRDLEVFFLDSAKHFISVDSRKPMIQEDKVRTLLLKSLESLFSCSGSDYIIS
jgi:hypothetical protein